MGSTFISLANKLLRRVRETEIPEADFANVRNIQALAKDAIVDTVNEINKQEFEWPFNAVEHSQDLQVGVSEYAWPTNFKTVDWNTFQIQKDDTLNINHRTLKYMSRDDWYRLRRDTDEDAGNEGSAQPMWCFPAHGNGFGVSPSPDKAYTIEFRYFKNPSALVDATDVCTIPSEFDYVIMSGALRHMNLFRENSDGYSIASSKFEDDMKDMTTLLINTFHSMSDTRTKYGGGYKYANAIDIG